MIEAAAAGVLACLADGTSYTRDSLAAAATLESQSLAEALALLADVGVEISQSEDGSLSLRSPVDRLAAVEIEAQLDPSLAGDVEIDVLAEAPSSNDVLIAQATPPAGQMPVCIVEFQHGGRGRRGRRWTAPPGGTLCLSAAWHFPGVPPDLSALSLVVAVAVLRALREAVNVAVGVKWPNDLVFDQRKLGGILVESRTDSRGTVAVAGIGMNVQVAPARLASLSDWPRGAVDLATAAGEPVPQRNFIAAKMISQLYRTFELFGDAGFAPFIDEWRAAHVLTDAAAVLQDGARAQHGTVRGIDADGALLFEHAGEVRRVLAGELSLRPSS
jgi:BirA family biotin operon repressor/biotin-[acetyl-CoA-carboxylase] ligase